MNALLLASALAFLAALGSLLLRGLPALDQAHRAGVALEQRADDLRSTLREVRPVSWDRLEQLEREVRDRARLVDARLSLLLAPSERSPTIDPVAALANTGLPALLPDGRLRPVWDELVARSPQLAQALFTTLEVLDEQGAFDLDELVGLEPAAVEGLPSLRQDGFELVITAELPAAVAILEALTPGPGSPVISVRAASIRRIAPGLWPQDPSGLSSPPIRLWMRLAAVSRQDGGAR